MKQSESQLRQHYYAYAIDLWKKTQLTESDNKQIAYIQYQRALQSMQSYMSKTQFKSQSQAICDQMQEKITQLQKENDFSLSLSSNHIVSNSYSAEVSDKEPIVEAINYFDEALQAYNAKNFKEALILLELETSNSNDVQDLIIQCQKEISRINGIKQKIGQQQIQLQQAEDQFTKISCLREIISLLIQIGNKQSFDLIPEFEKQIQLESNGVPLI